jgi:cephalosporin-C deacetylase
MTGLSEMPLEELKMYTGINPKPSDFDLYWDDAIKEMESIKSDIELIPADFKVPFANCFDLFFKGVGGAKIHAKLIQPKTSKKGPALLIFHGYSGDSGGWSDKPTKLCYAAMGYTVAALDCRGQGGLSEDKGGVQGWTLRGHIVRGLNDSPTKLLYRQIFLDAAQLAKIVMDFSFVDENRVGVTGESQGGGLSIACASLEPRIKKIAPIFPFLCDYKRVWEMDLAENSYAELKEYFRRFDPLHKRENEIFTKLGYIDVQHLASRIRGEVLMGVGLSDTICPPSTQFAAYNKINSKKGMQIYPTYGHERLPGHADLIFQFMCDL